MGHLAAVLISAVIYNVTDPHFDCIPSASHQQPCQPASQLAFSSIPALPCPGWMAVCGQLTGVEAAPRHTVFRRRKSAKVYGSLVSGVEVEVRF